MEFLVSLIKVMNKPEGRALESLNINCTHVKDNIYIMEGMVECLKDDGIDLKILSEGYVPSLGGLSEEELVKICDECLGITL